MSDTIPPWLTYKEEQIDDAQKVINATVAKINETLENESLQEIQINSGNSEGVRGNAHLQPMYRRETPVEKKIRMKEQIKSNLHEFIKSIMFIMFSKLEENEKIDNLKKQVRDNSVNKAYNEILEQINSDSDIDTNMLDDLFQNILKDSPPPTNTTSTSTNLHTTNPTPTPTLHPHPPPPPPPTPPATSVHPPKPPEPVIYTCWCPVCSTNNQIAPMQNQIAKEQIENLGFSNIKVYCGNRKCNNSFDCQINLSPTPPPPTPPPPPPTRKPKKTCSIM